MALMIDNRARGARHGVVAAIPAFAFAALAQGQWTVTALQPAGATESYVYGVSGDTQVGYAAFGGVAHAVLWHGSAGSVVDLHPAGASASQARAVSGARQVGYVVIAGTTRATQWAGSAASRLDFHPPGAFGSVMRACEGGRQAGYLVAPNPSFNHAYVWDGIATTGVDLHPLGATGSYALGVAGFEVAGYAITGGVQHGGTWHGDYLSWKDLNPPGAAGGSQILCTNGQQQGGFAQLVVSTPVHAIIWSGTAGSAIDLHPAGARDSRVMGVVGVGTSGIQVGYITDNASRPHAALWRGTAASFVDLGTVATGFLTTEATSVWTDGRTTYVGGWGSRSSLGEGLLWTLVEKCAADFDGDGFVTGDDYDAYALAFELGDARADFDGNGFVTGDDFDGFSAAFVAGCG